MIILKLHIDPSWRGVSHLPERVFSAENKDAIELRGQVYIVTTKGQALAIPVSHCVAEVDLAPSATPQRERKRGPRGPSKD